MKNTRFIVITMVISLISVILYFTVRGFYFRQKVTSYISEISTINHNCSKYIREHNKQKTLDKNLILKDMSSKSIESLSFCKYNVSKLKFPPKYQGVKQTILQSIDNSYTIYIESKNICSGASIESLSVSLYKIQKSGAELHNVYNTLNNYHLFSLGDTKNLDDFINACGFYVNAETERLRAFEIHSAKKQTFTNTLTNIYYELRTLISTNNYAKTSLRVIEAKKDLSPILLSIQDQQLTLSKLKIKLSSLSIPEGLNSYFYSVQGMLQSYDLYLANLSYTINAENIHYKNVGKRNMKLEAQYKKLEEDLSSLSLTVEDFSRNIDTLVTQ